MLLSTPLTRRSLLDALVIALIKLLVPPVMFPSMLGLTVPSPRLSGVTLLVAMMVLLAVKIL
jgi:hypothetical protein